MLTTRALLLGMCVIAVGAAWQNAPVKIKPNDIGGVVSSRKGPEAGVWVIAETTDLPTRYIKEVVTDDRGRYLIPDLPKPSTPSGRAATGWSTRPKWRPSPASWSI